MSFCDVPALVSFSNRKTLFQNIFSHLGSPILQGHSQESSKVIEQLSSLDILFLLPLVWLLLKCLSAFCDRINILL